MRRVYYGILVCFGIILISGIPTMFQDGLHLNIIFYLNNVKSIVSDLLTPWQMTYHPSWVNKELIYPLFPDYWGPYLYSLSVFFTSLFAAFLFSLILTYFTLFLSNKKIKRILFWLSMLESVPDITIIVIFQLGIIWIYQKTGMLLFNIATYDHNIYVLPIVCLALFPALLYYRVMLLVFQEELEKPYVEFAKGRGLTRRFIILVHVLRNALLTLFNHSKYIMWFVLSNYVMVEVIFHTKGVIWFVMKYQTPGTITITLLFLFIPIYILLSLIGSTIEKTTGQEESIE